MMVLERERMFLNLPTVFLVWGQIVCHDSSTGGGSDDYENMAV